MKLISKISKSKYFLHSLSSSLSIPEYQTFNSLIDCLLYAYENCIDFSITFSKSGKMFFFNVSDILKQFPSAFRRTCFDQYFLGFVSLLLTTIERDIFKKKLRSVKNV